MVQRLPLTLDDEQNSKDERSEEEEGSEEDQSEEESSEEESSDTDTPDQETVEEIFSNRNEELFPANLYGSDQEQYQQNAK